MDGGVDEWKSEGWKGKWWLDGWVSGWTDGRMDGEVAEGMASWVNGGGREG